MGNPFVGAVVSLIMGFTIEWFTIRRGIYEFHYPPPLNATVSKVPILNIVLYLIAGAIIGGLS